MDLQALLDAIDQLPIDKFQELRQHVNEHAPQLQQTPNPDVKARITALHAALAEFREEDKT